MTPSMPCDCLTESVGEGVFGVRSWGLGFRIYFGRDGNTITILLRGGTKKHQHCDIKEAKLSPDSRTIEKERSSTNDRPPLTLDSIETFRERRDLVFRTGMLEEGFDYLLSAEVDVGKLKLEDFVEVTIGPEKLGEQLDKSPKSLRQAFDPKRDTSARDLREIVACLLKFERMHMTAATTARRAPKRRATAQAQSQSKGDPR
jgi:hypothetical protein